MGRGGNQRDKKKDARSVLLSGRPRVTPAKEETPVDSNRTEDSDSVSTMDVDDILKTIGDINPPSPEEIQEEIKLEQELFKTKLKYIQEVHDSSNKKGKLESSGNKKKILQEELYEEIIDEMLGDEYGQRQ